MIESLEDLLQAGQADSVIQLAEHGLAEVGDDYWLERDDQGGFPEDFYRAMAEGGWLGIGFPEEFGGSCPFHLVDLG